MLAEAVQPTESIITKAGEGGSSLVIAEGLSTSEVATKLIISVKTARTI